MKGYKQLTQIQRYQIESLKKAEMFQKDIAVIIGISASALSRELSRNTGKRGYRPHQANIKALSRRKNAVKAVKMTLEVCSLIEEKVQLDYSPEQVSGWLSTEKDIKISHERIYQHVWTDKQSMSRKGDCWDNAPTERFFCSLKYEQLNYGKFRSKESVKLSIIDYLAFYNGKRIHSKLSYQSPIQ